MDHVTPLARSKIMAAVKSKDTGPELAIRRALHRRGYRYALHSPDLPGKPDLVFRPRRKIIFVHGCFWHGHHCKKGRLPNTRLDYWCAKIDANRERDKRITQPRYAHSISRPVSAQFMADDIIALFELNFDGDDVSIVQERHYRLAAAAAISDHDLRAYQKTAQ